MGIVNQEDIYEFPEPYIATTIVVLTQRESKKYSVLIGRRSPVLDNYPSYFALPGRAAYLEETTKKTAVINLNEETGLTINEEDLILFNEYPYSNGDLQKDNNICYYVIVNKSLTPALKSGGKIAELFWCDIDAIITNNIVLAFDHAQIIKDGWHKYQKDTECLIINV